MLVLINQDLSFYRVQLWNPSDTDYPAMYGVVPPLGRLVMMGGAGNQRSEYPLYISAL
jgi:hypothetical protein